jgi:hypothetical protein
MTPRGKRRRLAAAGLGLVSATMVLAIARRGQQQ